MEHDFHLFHEKTYPEPNIQPGGLYLVATPIGHLADISSRALAVLNAVDLILCEDTRTTARLLTHYDIRTPTEPLHEHNERHRLASILGRLEKKLSIALVSDAGTPLVSDPGYRLVREAIAAGFVVTTIPGANAVVSALTVSGFPPAPFMFMGFAPPRRAARCESLGRIQAAERAGISATLIWYEAPHRLLEMLTDLRSVFGAERRAAIARELTKKFEEVRRGSLDELVAFYQQHEPRGEITLVLAPPAEQEASTGASQLDAQIREALRTLSVKDAAALVAGATALPKKHVYARTLELARQNRPEES